MAAPVLKDLWFGSIAPAERPAPWEPSEADKRWAVAEPITPPEDPFADYLPCSHCGEVGGEGRVARWADDVTGYLVSEDRCSLCMRST